MAFELINLLIIQTHDLSRSFKVIDFCSSRKPIYYFLLVIIVSHLSSISHAALSGSHVNFGIKLIVRHALSYFPVKTV